MKLQERERERERRPKKRWPFLKNTKIEKETEKVPQFKVWNISMFQKKGFGIVPGTRERKSRFVRGSVFQFRGRRRFRTQFCFEEKDKERERDWEGGRGEEINFISFDWLGRESFLIRLKQKLIYSSFAVDLFALSLMLISQFFSI